MKDDQRVGLLKETLEVLFGLEESTVHRVVRIIKSSTDSIDVRTPNIRRRIGPRAMQYLRNSIEIARHEGTEKHEDEKSNADNSKSGDIAQSSRRTQTKKKTKKKTNESTSFKDFLITEVSIDVDLDDQQGSMQALRRAQRLNKTSPERLNRENTIKAKEEQRDAQRSGGTDPSANIKSKIAKKKIELGGLNKRLNSMKTVTDRQQPSEGQI